MVVAQETIRAKHSANEPVSIIVSMILRSVMSMQSHAAAAVVAAAAECMPSTLATLLWEMTSMVPDMRPQQRQSSIIAAVC